MAWSPISGTMTQYSTSANNLASNYYIKFYQSGTTTAFNMATDSTGGTTLDKCQLDSSGYPTTDGSTRFIPYINQKYKIVLYKNSTDADNNTTGNADWIIDAIDQLQTGDSDAWVLFSGTPTQTSATTFTVTGDQTATFTVGSRLKFDDSSTLYGIITASAYTTLTTVTVNLDSGSLSGSLSAVYTGISTTVGQEISSDTVSYNIRKTNTKNASAYEKFSERVSALDFMTAAQKADVKAGTASVDVTTPLLNAIASGEPIWLPEGGYLVDGELDTFTGNDIVFSGQSMERTFIQATSNVTGAIIDINVGGAERYSRGLIGNFKILGAKTGSNPNWYDDTYFSSHGIRVSHVVNGMVIERVRVLRTNTAGIEFTGFGTWFNTIREAYIEKCKGSGIYLKQNANGVQLESCRSYLCTTGVRIEDSLGVNLSGCAIEDTKDDGLRMTGQSVVAIQGAWFEDHGMVDTTKGAIHVSGVVGNTDRPAALALSGVFFNSVGNYVVKGENCNVSLDGCQSDGSTSNIFEADTDTQIDDQGANFWVYSGTLYGGTAGVSGIVTMDSTWTPVLSDAETGGNTATFDANASSQQYFKNGRQVTIQARLENIDTTGMTGGNVFYVQGLPITSSSACHSTGTCELTSVTISGAYVVPVVVPSKDAFYLLDVNSGSTPTTIKVSDITASTADIKITMTYIIS